MTLPCIISARRFDACAHTPFWTGEERVGWIGVADVPLLTRWPDVFDIDDARVTLSARFDTLDLRSAALGQWVRFEREREEHYWASGPHYYGPAWPGFYRGRWNGGGFGPCWTQTPIGPMWNCGR